MFTAEQIEGCYVALITPMRQVGYKHIYEVDYDHYFEVIRSCVDAGVTGLLFAGTTGQSATFSHDEHVEVATRAITYAHKYVREQGQKVQIFASAGSNATFEAVELSERIVSSVQVDALLHVTGYYNNPPQEGLIAHFETIANALQPHQVPIIMYNVPSRTKSDLAAETTIQLACHPNIIGIKEASGDLGKVDQIIAHTNSRQFRVVSGEDHLVYEIMRSGGTGVISATANRWPEEFQQLTELCKEGQWEAGEELQEALLPCCEAVFCVKNPIPLAYMFNSSVRLPLVGISQLKEPIRQEAERKIQKALSIESFPHVTARTRTAKIS